MATKYILEDPSGSSVTRFDAHGQPLARFGFLRANNLAKAFDQLSGVCKGVLCDGVVSDDEARFFYEWVRTHTTAEMPWPFGEILGRLKSIFADGVITEDERQDLADIMRKIVGGSAEGYGLEVDDTSTTLPLDDPAPAAVEFGSREFCVTGRFAFGTRKKVIEAITTRGGSFNDVPRNGTAYLVIGFFASKDWKYSSYGTKMERALQLRRGTNGIKIIAEEHWRRFLPLKVEGLSSSN